MGTAKVKRRTITQQANHQVEDTGHLSRIIIIIILIIIVLWW
jgi:hypothetical protein